MLHALSIDVEDYYNQLAIDFCDRVEPPREAAARDTERMLALCAEHGVKTTCFILGEMAEYFPWLVRQIAEAGHHIGVHAYYHHQIWRHTPKSFREVTKRAIGLLQDVTGKKVNAHRAVAFSLTRETLWALPILADLGIEYDSSIFPFRGRRYGISDAMRGPHRLVLPDGRSLWEYPLSTVEALRRRWPACGGGYLRHFPLAYTRWAIRKLTAEGLPCNLYLHPYEVEVPGPIDRIPGIESLRQKLKFSFFNFHQTRNRAATEKKLTGLMRDFTWGPIPQVLAQWQAANPDVPSVQLAAAAVTPSAT